VGRRQPGLRPRKWKQRRVFFGGHLDRTERKWAEEALQKAQAERELEVSSQKAGNIQGESKEERSEDRALTEVEWTHVLITVRYSGRTGS